MGYFQGGQVIDRLKSIATAGGTTTLVVSNEKDIRFTGTLNQTVVLPDATTLPLNYAFTIRNQSTGTITVNKNGGTLVKTVGAGVATEFKVADISSAPGTWDVYSSTAGGGAVAAAIVSLGNGASNVVVSFPSSISGTYVITWSFENTTDTDPIDLTAKITAKNSSGFTATFNAPTDSANYNFAWQVNLTT